MQTQKFTTTLGGKELTAEFSDLANQANGSVIIRFGQTVILVTAVMGAKKEGIDFFPLTVDYEERFYASGQILGSRFVRREGKPTDEAILSGRIVDRTIRPLFNNRIRNEVQVIVTVLSIGEDDPDTLSVIGASLALAVSDIPWNGPVSGLRLLKLKNSPDFIVQPNYAVRESGDAEMDLVVCGKDGLVNMIEVGSQEVSEEILNEGIKTAVDETLKLQKFQEDIIKAIGKQKALVSLVESSEKVTELFESEIRGKIPEAVFTAEGKSGINDLSDYWKKLVNEKLAEADRVGITELFEEELDKFIHQQAVKENRRPDGRDFDEIRKLFAGVGGISPIHHGTGIFYRGGTHVMSVLTLGGPNDSQIIDGMEPQSKKRFMHHYNFPPFSSGETGRVGGTNRRMIGHGALAEKALIAVLPGIEQFPYTIRIVSEAFASNGSTSMASVCASTLALMDGGVPIKKPVAGIASGLMMKDGEYKILTDIQGPEDHYGDMDFKVAGTKDGVTAVQMDVKVEGIPVEVLAQAFIKAKKARLHILDLITATIATPREKISDNAPKILILKIKKDQIGMVIGTGGKTINAIKEQTGAQIDIEDDGTIFITGKNGSAEETYKIIDDMTREIKAGDKFTGEVVKVVDFGAFVKIGYSNEGLVHISEMAPFRVDDIFKYLKEGMSVPVVVKGVDERGKIALSIKSADSNFFAQK